MMTRKAYSGVPPGLGYHGGPSPSRGANDTWHEPDEIPAGVVAHGTQVG